MPAPFEVVLGPAEVWLAPVGEDFPSINETPAGNWVLVGTNGALNYGEEGVKLMRDVATAPVYVLGGTTIRKMGITQTGFRVEFPVLDMSPDEMLLAYGGDPDDVDETAAAGGEAGFSTITIPTSPVPISRSVLVRAAFSATADGFNTQWQIVSAVQVGSAESTFSKSTPFTQRHTWQALDTGSGFVTVVQQTAAVSP